jgi:hypothetical protein
LDDDVKKGIRKLRELPRDPTAFEEWAEKTFDMSRMRKR